VYVDVGKIKGKHVLFRHLIYGREIRSSVARIKVILVQEYELDVAIDIPVVISSQTESETVVGVKADWIGAKVKSELSAREPWNGLAKLQKRLAPEWRAPQGKIAYFMRIERQEVRSGGCKAKVIGKRVVGMSC
jgi:hypothetical protein